MIRKIRDFFYNYSEVIAATFLVVVYITVIFAPVLPELLIVDYALVLAVVAIAAATVVGYAIYGISYSLALGGASLLDWIWELDEPVIRATRDDVLIDIPSSDEEQDIISANEEQDIISANKDTISSHIIESMIYNTPYSRVLIASDGRPYDKEELEGINKSTRCSPYTRKIFQGIPFPYHFVKHSRFIQAPNPDNLIHLFTCPVTNQIMTDPVVANLIYSTPRGYRIPFVLVCDKSALKENNLPANIKRAKDERAQDETDVDYEPLQLALADQKLRDALIRNATTLVPERDIAQGWERAFKRSAIDFPSTTSPRDLRHFTYVGAVNSLFFGSDDTNDNSGDGYSYAGPR
jgi:hypothetical protein